MAAGSDVFGASCVEASNRQCKDVSGFLVSYSESGNLRDTVITKYIYIKHGASLRRLYNKPETLIQILDICCCSFW